MDELIAQIATKAGLDIATARQAAGIVLAFLQKEAPPEELSKLFAALPGAETLALTEGGNAGGGGIMGALGGLMGGGGGGLMALAGQLGAAGLLDGPDAGAGPRTLRLRPRKGRRRHDGRHHRGCAGARPVRLRGVGQGGSVPHQFRHPHPEEQARLGLRLEGRGIRWLDLAACGTLVLRDAMRSRIGSSG